jgi:hypothetical protein
MGVREESESVANCSPFYSSPEASKKHQTFLAKRLSSTLCVIDRTQMFFLTLVKIVPFHPFSPTSNVLFDRGSFAPFHLGPMEGEGVLLLPQMFFLNPGIIVPSHLCCLCFLCLNVLFKPGQDCTFSPLPMRERGGGGVFTDFPHRDYIMSCFTLSILYIISYSFYLILPCERVENILFSSFSWTRPESNKPKRNTDHS